MSQENDRKATILVVDDTPENINILQETLSNEYKIKAAISGDKALKIAMGDKPPDMILLDIMMPEMDGFEVCRRLKANSATKDIPVIFCTALTKHSDEMMGLELGAVDYIRKPFSPPIVKTRIRNYLQLKDALNSLKKQNQILVENAQLRNDVERMVRHDIKTPLNSIINIPNLLISEGSLTPNQSELVQIVEESGYRILEIVNSSFDLIKMEKGEYRLNPVPVDLMKLVSQVHGETRILFNSKSLELSMYLNGSPIQEKDEFIVYAEEMLAYSMLANLVKNAFEASPEGERILINFSDDDPPIVSIHNKGAVPEEIRGTFFDKYVTAGKTDGTGLGAYSARLIARTLGGDLNMSTSEQLGTTLSIKLPPAKNIPMADAVWRTGFESVPERLQKLTVQSAVLVVDDYKNMRKTIINMLKKMGFTKCLEAPDGRIAMEIFKTVDIGLVISDWNMPEMTGIELLKNIRSSSRNHDTPFIMITGESSKENVLEALKAQANEYIIKPFSADILIEKVKQLFI